MSKTRQNFEIEIWYVSTNTYLVLENVPFIIKALLILLMSAVISAIVLQKNVYFLAKIVPLIKTIVLEIRDFLVLFAVFVR